MSKTFIFSAIFLLFYMLFITGCNSTVVQSERLPLDVPSAPELKMRTVTWEIKDSKICVDSTQYSNLTLNTEDIKAFIMYQNKVIEMYKEYYEPKNLEKDYK